MSETPTPMDLDPNIFRAYDIRGIVNQSLSNEVVYWIGRAFAAEARGQGQSRVVVGGDGRPSSSSLRKALTCGLIHGGCEPLVIGCVPTPVLYYATHALKTGTGIMITGSHNPPEYNGLKMMIGGIPLSADAIQRIRNRILTAAFSNGDVDQKSAFIANMIDRYSDHIKKDIMLSKKLKVVVDCGNGVASLVAPQLFVSMGCDVIPLYAEVDGRFPNHHPDPADPKNLQDLIEAVGAEGADIGLAFDGDGDRIGVVTNSGTIVWPDTLMMLFARDIIDRNPGASVVYDVKCSRHLNSIIIKHGGNPIMCKTGHSHIKTKVKDTDALLGGEFSGHICFADRWFGFDDAIYSAARLLELIGAQSDTIEEIFGKFPKTFMTPELKIKTSDSKKFEIVEELRMLGDFGGGKITTIDGIRVDYDDGFGLIRPSNTSPILSLRFEADGQAALERIQSTFQTQLSNVDPNLRII